MAALRRIAPRYIGFPSNRGSSEIRPATIGAEEDVIGEVAEAPWSVAEWAVALRFDNPRATVLVLLLG